MSRIFLDDLRDDINTLMADNNTQNITPAVQRGVLLDMVDSTTQQECAIIGQIPTLAVPTTTAFVPLTTIYDAFLGGDGDFLNPDFANGEIVGSSIAGWTYDVVANITLEGLGAGIACEFVIMRDGVQEGYIGGVTGDGSGDPVSTNVRFYDLKSLVDSTYTLGVRTPAGNDTIDVLDVILSVTIQPTNNPD